MTDHQPTATATATLRYSEDRTIEVTAEQYADRSYKYDSNGGTYLFRNPARLTLKARVNGRWYAQTSRTAGDLTANEAAADKYARSIADKLAADDHDDAIAPRLRRLSTGLERRVDAEALRSSSGEVALGDVAFVYGFGAWRRGIVTKCGRTRATVSYVCPSSPRSIKHGTAGMADVIPARG